MKQALPVLLIFLFIVRARAQQSDFIVIKKHNDKPLKTYYPGSFLSAETFDGFKLNGFITAIRNDSIILQQQQTILTATEFGSKVDTVNYTLGLYYKIIKKFNFGGGYEGGKKKGFVEVTIPKLMIIGGIGWITLELVNTAYRHETLTQETLVGLGIAAGVAATGFLWNYVSKSRNQVGGKYKVVYIKANTAIHSK